MQFKVSKMYCKRKLPDIVRTNVEVLNIMSIEIIIPQIDEMLKILSISLNINSTSWVLFFECLIRSDSFIDSMTVISFIKAGIVSECTNIDQISRGSEKIIINHVKPA